MNNTTADPGHQALHVFQRYSVSDLLNTFAPAGVLAERVVPPVWYVIGFLGNPISGIVWFGRRMRRNNSSAVYLGSLAVSDTAFLLLHLLHSLHVAWGYDVYNSAGGCETFMTLFYIPQYLSVVLVAAFTVERYVAVCHPFLKEKWCTVRRAGLVTLLCLTLSAALSSAQAYIWTYHPALRACSTRAQAAAGDGASFWVVWTWVVDMTLFAALPLVVLLFNALVLREIVRLSRHGVVRHQHNHRGTAGGGGGGGRGGGGGGGGRGGGGSNNTASTLTLLSVSFFLIVTQLTATVVSNLQPAFPTGPVMLSDEGVRADPTWSRLFAYLQARKVVETLCLSHFACYFFLYCLTGKHFRREVVFLLTCRGRLRVPYLSHVMAGSNRGERYSMVSSNGHTLATETYSTAVTSAM